MDADTKKTKYSKDGIVTIKCECKNYEQLVG